MKIFEACNCISDFITLLNTHEQNHQKRAITEMLLTILNCPLFIVASNKGILSYLTIFLNPPYFPTPPLAIIDI